MLSPKFSKEVSFDNSPQKKIEEEVEKLAKPKARYTSNLIGSLIEEEPHFNNQDRSIVEEASKRKIDRKLSQDQKLQRRNTFLQSAQHILKK